MIINLLRFRFRDEVSEAERADALAAISRTASLDAVAFSVIGRDLGDPAAGFTHAYLVAIPGLEALERYFDAPVHRAGDFQFIPLVAKLSRSGFTSDDDPDLGEKIMALWRRKMSADPGWLALFDLVPELSLTG
ncbi:Dabb family protein [Chondromyces apiculatus]|uniref:Stress-response A/B barrel domain-containing protein n=1 Tax=Chondromyces apiculatus DSM 436 TaxID=1192034 RepID=A0A017T3L0_9BACT|nr:Dabb family protein [Chondromyces apiculatus]EYF03838.1 Hypothetical protein CAP_5102 [Chondromyces apiculatus DSM 436]